MKNIIRLTLISLIALAMVSCGAAKKAALQAAQEETMKETKIEIPLSGPQYMTDENYFRATSNSTSRDMALAKEVAMHEARLALANDVKAAIQNVTKSYVDKYGNEDEYKHYQRMGVTVAEIVLPGSTLVAEELYRLADGTYRYHVCMQLSKEEIVKEALKEVQEAEAKAAEEADATHKANEASFEEFFVEAIKSAR